MILHQRKGALAVWVTRLRSSKNTKLLGQGSLLNKFERLKTADAVFCGHGLMKKGMGYPDAKMYKLFSIWLVTVEKSLLVIVMQRSGQ